MVLTGDIGGTKVNLALFVGSERIKEKRYQAQDFSGIEEILDDFLTGNASKIEKACFGVAGPVVDGKCRLTNLSWLVDTEKLRKQLNVQAVRLINDLTAMACAIPFLQPEDFEVLQSGVSVKEGQVAVISAGTGLGQAFLIPQSNGKYIALDSEGGHCDFSPRNNLEAELLFFLQNKYSRVSLERVLSGTGLLDVFEFFEGTNSGMLVGESPASIVEKAIAKSSSTCEKTLKLFVSLYGALAGNLALQYLSSGGVYLGGGIAPKILPLLQEGDFMEAFLAKGRFKGYLSQIPVNVVMNESAPLLGAACYDMSL